MQNPYFKKAPKSKLNKTERTQKISLGLLIAIFVVVLAIMYFVFPNQKQTRALKTLGGDVEDSNAIGVDSYYSPLLISEVMTVNTSAVPDENGEFNDYIEIYNSGNSDINLRGVGLSDRHDKVKFLFPDYILGAKSFVVVYTSNKNKTDVNNSIFHAKFKLTSLGESIFLFDPNAYVVDGLKIPPMSSNEAYLLTGDGNYGVTRNYSPGFDNSEEGHIAYKTSNAVSFGAVIINEIMPDPRSGLRDEDDTLSDWIELYNTTDQEVSLSNFALSDREDKPLKWRFPSDTKIGPKSYLIVMCSGKDIQGSKYLHTNFKISPEKETIVLSDSKGRLLDRVPIDNVPSDASYARQSDSTFQISLIPSPGASNDKQGEELSDKILKQLNPSNVYISEVLSSNDAVQLGPSLLTSDYVELYNASDKPVNLSGCGLSDDLSRPRRWTFPANSYIQPQSYLIVMLDANIASSSPTELHANFKLKREGGEYISFSDPTGRILDRIPLPEIKTNMTYGRVKNGYGFSYFKTATPLKDNENAILGFAETPSFSIPGGKYTGEIKVAINVPDECSVYYTTDGSIPNENSSQYMGQEFDVNNMFCLRARAYRHGYEPSDVVTQSYLVNLYHSLPVVSLTCDPDELFNKDRGIFTEGPNIDRSKGIPFKNAIYREYGKIERPGHIEMYLQDGTKLLDQDMEFGLQGQYSLDMPQKTLKVRSKSRYGSKYFYTQLFEDRPFTEYKTFVLRNSGNDNVWTRLVDAFQQQLVNHLDTTVIHQAWRPVVVYINGHYWGHYNLRERADRFFIAQHEGIGLANANNMDVVEANRKTYFGSNAEFQALKKKALELDTKNSAEDLKYLTDRIDVDNFFDYMAIEMFFGNSDPGNMRCYKLRQDGAKWRWLLFDLDYGMFNSRFNSPRSYLKPTGSGDQNINNTFILKLLENDSMKDLFLSKLGKIFQTLTSQLMQEELDKMIAQIEPELPLHFNRWAEFNDKAINFDSPTTPQGAMGYWKQRISRLRDTINWRPARLFEFVQEKFELSDQQMLDYFGPKPPAPEK